ncbi:hypothetical protein L3i22_072330 [Actinoplanes sp. L3-i22]|nr:hypothetical protein L3i22_072330 [Actinoplanes sp. L3-i22]
MQYFTTSLTIVGAMFALVVVVTSVLAAPPVLEALKAYAFVAAWLTVIGRTAWSGLFLGDDGIRLRTLLRTRTIPWAEIASVDPVHENFLGRPADRMSIRLTLRDGTRVIAPVESSGPPSFFRTMTTVLKPADFHAALAEIDQRLTAVRG